MYTVKCYILHVPNSSLEFINNLEDRSIVIFVSYVNITVYKLTAVNFYLYDLNLFKMQLTRCTE